MTTPRPSSKKSQIVPELAASGLAALPAIIQAEGRNTATKFLEFFGARIRNKNTRQAYMHAVAAFLNWCEKKGVAFQQIQPLIVAAYIEQHPGSAPTVKQHLAAIRMMYDHLVTNQVVPVNPAASVRGPSHVVRVGKTPVLDKSQARELLDSMDSDRIADLRDRAIIGIMIFSFARVGAVVRLDLQDYYQSGKRWWLRFHEKGGKRHQVPAHHNIEAYLDAYIEAAGIAGRPKQPLFRTFNRKRELTDQRITRTDAYRMVKRRAAAAGIGVSISCHTFRATGITAYLENGGTIENAQLIAAHESPRTTKLYDRTGDTLTLDEIERIAI